MSGKKPQKKRFGRLNNQQKWGRGCKRFLVTEGGAGQKRSSPPNRYHLEKSKEKKKKRREKRSVTINNLKGRGRQKRHEKEDLKQES